MLLMSEQYVNRTEGYRTGETDPYEPWTQDVGKLYRTCVREFGRCTGKVRIDTTARQGVPIGWVFLKRRAYDDSPETFLQETWVTLHDATPTTTVDYHYHELGGRS